MMELVRERAIETPPGVDRRRGVEREQLHEAANRLPTRRHRRATREHPVILMR
jgi:hypothetical protein